MVLQVLYNRVQPWKVMFRLLLQASTIKDKIDYKLKNIKKIKLNLSVRWRRTKLFGEHTVKIEINRREKIN